MILPIQCYASTLCRVNARQGMIPSKSICATVPPMLLIYPSMLYPELQLHASSYSTTNMLLLCLLFQEATLI